MSKIRIYGDTSGYIDVAAPATADNSTLDLSTVAKSTGAQAFAGDVTLNGAVTIEDEDGGWSPDSKLVFKGGNGEMGYIGHNSSDELSIMNNSIADTKIYTNGIPRITVDGFGRVTMPYQPYFEARRNGDLSGFNTGNYATSVQFNLTDTNIGNNYSTTTGLFTAPVTGVYAFDAWVYANTAMSQAWLTINGGRGGKTDVVQSTSGNFVGGSWTVKLTANDTVGFHPYANGGTITIYSNGNHTYFRGCLIG